MSSWWRDRVTIIRGEASGQQDPVTGEWIPGPGEQVILDCPANVQAGGLIAASRRSISTVYADADGAVVVPKPYHAALLDVEPEDRVLITYGAMRRAGTIIERSADAIAKFVRPEDRTLLVQYV